MASVQEIEARVKPMLEAAGVELVDVQYRREPSGWVLRFYLDRPGGFGLADCQEWSDRIEGVVDGEGLVTHGYSLEVSSPGLDRPLKTREHFERFQGIEARVTTTDPLGNQRNFHGRIEGVDGGDLDLTDRTSGRVRIALANIASARLDPGDPAAYFQGKEPT